MQGGPDLVLKGSAIFLVCMHALKDGVGTFFRKLKFLAAKSNKQAG